MIIRFLNWDKFNLKSSHTISWVRLNTNICSRPIWDELSHSQFRVFIYFLCQANQNEKRGQFMFSSRSASRHCGTTENDINRAIEILKRFQIIELRTPSGHFLDSEETLPTNEKNEKNEKKELIHAGSPVGSPVFDFESLYKKYPRKEGKARGIKTCKVQIKTPEQFDLLSKAIDRYAAHCQKEATSAQYIKHFGTFMSGWRDWLDPETGSAIAVKSGIDIWREQMEALERQKAEGTV